MPDGTAVFTADISKNLHSCRVLFPHFLCACLPNKCNFLNNIVFKNFTWLFFQKSFKSPGLLNFLAPKLY